MIVDITYIKNVLEVSIDDSQMQYLLHHFFDDICRKINVQTTLEEQEISDIALSTTYETPMLGYNDTSLFQDTIIYGIACHLEKTNILTISLPQVLYNEYIEKIDLSTLSIDNDQYILTFCDLYTYCVEELKIFLNDESQVGYLRQLLNLQLDIVSDREIEFLIGHYTQYFKDIMPNVDEDSAYFKQALYLSIACHIFRTNPQAIISPTEYRVDETSEVFNLAFDKEGNTWCDLADAALADLKKKTYKNYGVKVFDRPGARTKYHAWGPE
jgi:hypothetical protein